jgi:TolA-binding protein
MKKITFLISLLFIVFQINQLKAQTVADEYSAAMSAYHSEEYAAAERLFQKFFSDYSIKDEMYATAKYYSADSFMKLGEKDAAADGFQFIVDHFSWSQYREKALYNLSMIYFEQQNYDKSREKFNYYLNEYPGSDSTGSVLYWIGETYIKENRLDDAIKFLKDAIAKNLNDKYIDYTIYNLASIYEKQGDYVDAVKYYDELLSYHSDSPLALSAHIRIGICYFKLKNYDSSVLELNNPVLSNLPHDLYAESIYLLANSYYRLQDYPNAEKAYLEILQKYPASDELRSAKYGLAWTYFQEKKYNEAYKIFDNLSIGTDSLAVKSFFWKAESKRYAGQEQEAFKIYNQFLDHFPNSDLITDVEYQMGVLYFNNKNYTLAEKYLQSSLPAADSTLKSKALIVLGEMNLEKKNYASAQNYFERVQNAAGVSNEILNRASLGLGVAYYYLHKFNKAVSILNDVSKKDSKFESNKINYYLAESYYELGRFNDALNMYANIDLQNKDYASSVAYGEAYCYFDLGNYDGAAKKFTEFIKQYPDDSRNLDSRLRLADSYYASKHFDAASNVYKEIFNYYRGSRENPYVYYRYAQALYKAGEIQSAISEFGTVQQKFPNSEYADKSLYTIGWIYFQQSNYDQAISQYRSALYNYPSSSLCPMLYYSIGDSYFNMSKYDSAIVNYQKVLINYPSSSHVFDAVNGIQYSYVAEGKPQEAINLIDTFVKQNPGLAFADQIFIKKGDIYYSIQDYKNAEISYKEFAANYPNSKLLPEAYYWIGKSAENLGENEEAIYYFKRVFSDYPQSESAPAAVLEMGNVYNQQKNYNAALGIYNQALNQLPNKLRFPEIMYMKANTLNNMKNTTGAAQVYNNIIQNYSGTIFAAKSNLQLGLMSLTAKDYNSAVNDFEKLATNRTDDIGAQAQYLIGETLFQQKKYDDAITAFMRVKNIFPSYEEWVAKSYLGLGDCYVAKKEVRQAKEVYRILLTKHRGDDYGKEAKSMLRKLR